MGLQRLRPSQVQGVNNSTMTEDIQSIYDKALTYDKPVATVANLPLVGNQDGDVRLVLETDTFYIWDEPTQEWKAKQDKSTEARTSDIPITIDGQENFTTDLLVGVANGIASLNTIRLSINGVLQSTTDYTLGVTGQVPPRLIITWKSTDFPLDPTDIMTVEYDILIVE